MPALTFPKISSFLVVGIKGWLVVWSGGGVGFHAVMNDDNKNHGVF
jgi:hypothetical protein